MVRGFQTKPTAGRLSEPGLPAHSGRCDFPAEGSKVSDDREIKINTLVLLSIARNHLCSSEYCKKKK